LFFLYPDTLCISQARRWWINPCCQSVYFAHLPVRVARAGLRWGSTLVHGRASLPMYCLRSVSLKSAAAAAALMAFIAAPPSMAGMPAAPVKASSSIDYMPVGGPVPAPTGYLDLCTRSPSDCQQSAGDSLERIAAGARTALIEKRQSQILTAK